MFKDKCIIISISIIIVFSCLIVSLDIIRAKEIVRTERILCVKYAPAPRATKVCGDGKGVGGSGVIIGADGALYRSKGK